MAPKRTAPAASTAAKASKKPKKEEEGEEGGKGIAVDEGDTPLVLLNAALEAAGKVKALPAKKNGVVVYWMR